MNVTQANNAGNLLPPAKVGFIGYVKVGRIVLDYSRDRIVSISGYYTDPALEQESIDVDFGNTQPIWISIPVPANAGHDQYKGEITISGKNGKKPFSITKDYTVKVYPVTVEKTSLWVTNWFTIDTLRLKLLNYGKTIEPFSGQHLNLIRILAKKIS